MTSSRQRRRASERHYLMCPPTHFAVGYAINPWMDPAAGVDVATAVAQWTTLRDTYRSLGHRVAELPPVAGLPDMVFAANGAVVVDGVAVGSRFRHAQRAPEALHHRTWLDAAGIRGPHGRPAAPPADADAYLEGEGDVVVAGDVLLLGTGFRSTPAAAGELRRAFRREVVVLELIDPWLYHLDVALVALDAETIAYHPPAFSPSSRAVLARRYPDAIVVDAHDTSLLALNAVSDGLHVVVPPGTRRFADDVAARGYRPIEVDLSELRRGGGGAKCCTLELRGARRRHEVAARRRAVPAVRSRGGRAAAAG